MIFPPDDADAEIVNVLRDVLSWIMIETVTDSVMLVIVYDVTGPFDELLTITSSRTYPSFNEMKTVRSPPYFTFKFPLGEIIPNGADVMFVSTCMSTEIETKISESVDSLNTTFTT